MAHFAKIQNSKVVEVIVVHNNECNGGDFPESESVGQAFIASCGIEGEWKQTSYSGSFRGRFAGINMIYDEDLDEFVAPEEPAES
jgi:hypothetical protein